MVSFKEFLLNESYILYKREIGGEMIEKVMYGELGKGIPKN